jgi:hypothetical protein
MPFEHEDSCVQTRQKTLLVDQAVWTVAELLSAHTERAMLDAHLGPKEWMCRTLITLDDLGYAERSTDENGNLVFKSAPKLLAEVGQKAGELQVRGYIFSGQP